MASSSETPATEQVITEIFAKSLHIILQSRSPYVSSRNYSLDQLSSSPCSSSGSPFTGSSGPRDKWFNLALHECPAALENSDFWRASNLDPLVIDILLVNRESRTEKLLERWVVQYESRKQPNMGRKSKRTYYRAAIILFRSLYFLVRLLPAYNLFRDINSSGQIRPLGLTHRIQLFVNPLTRLEEAEMKQDCLTPIETPSGRLSHSVWYLPVLDDICVMSEPSTPLSTEFIPDYVGSPTTDPLKRFHTLPLGGSAPICVQPSRRHSWSTDRLGAPIVLPSSLPSISNPHSLSYKERPSIPLPPSETQRRNKGPEHCYQFSVSSSEKALLLRCDSAPISRGADALCNPSCKPVKDNEHKELVRFRDPSVGTSLPKEISIGGDGIRYLERVNVPLTSGPWLRGSKDLSTDFNEDNDANYPFVPDAVNRGHDYEGERSQGAIVGAILRMLKTAPKLQIEYEKSDSQDHNPNPSLSGSRTAADALQELRNYMNMRDSIVNQSGPHPSEPDPEKEAKDKGANSGKEMQECRMP